MQNNSNKMLVILISNISIDCTVDVNLYLPSGIIFYNGCFTVLNPYINQTITYI
jgi:hypothetical protein